MSRTLLLCAIAALAALVPLSASAQGNQSPLDDSTRTNRSLGQGTPMYAPPAQGGDEAHQQLLLNYRKQRQLELIRDAEKLHQLSGELQDFLSRNGSAVLSLDMLKKAEMAERLAHSVRTKMKELQ